MLGRFTALSIVLALFRALNFQNVHSWLPPVSPKSFVNCLKLTVQETEFQEPGSRGRPAVGLTLDTASWHYLCVRIGLGSMTLALRDLRGTLVAEEEIALSVRGELPLLARIVTEIDLFLLATSISWNA